MIKRGFTLIELLVVIAIIAILAAILFPVFAQAREKARGTTCLSNAKQLGTGLQLYTDDYDETLPRCYGWGYSVMPGSLAEGYSGVTRPNALGCLMDYVAGNNAFTKYREKYTTGQDGLPGLFKCPSDSAMRSVGNHYVCSYFYWGPGVDINTGGEGPALATIDNSAGTVCVIERGQEELWDTDSWNGKFGHNGMTPAIFCDGHAKAMKTQSSSQRWGRADNDVPWPVDPDTIWSTK